MIEWISLLDYWPCFILLGFIWAPKSWTPGELVSAASMNTNIRDHLNESLRTQSTALTGTQNNFAIEGPFVYLQCTNASELVITGALVDSGNVNGAKLFVEALDKKVILGHQRGTSTTSNRIITPNGEDLVLELSDRILLIYDGSNERWRAVNTARSLILDSLSGINLLGDPEFKIWPDGDSSTPAWWRTSGEGIVIAREIGNVLGDANAFKMTYDAAAVYLTQELISNGEKTQAIEDALVGDSFSCGVWIYTTGSDCKVVLGEDVNGVYTDVITPGSWQWVKHTIPITAAIDRLWFGVRLNDAGYVIVALPTVIKGAIAPDYYIPGTSRPMALGGQKIGDPAATGEIIRLTYKNPFIVDYVRIEAESNATGQALIGDVNQGANSMFGTRPEIAVDADGGGATPDGTYAYRCFDSVHGSGARKIILNIDQAATGGGKNPSIIAYGITYAPPLQAWRAYNSYK